MYFKRLDERQKTLVYRCGFESFTLLFVLCLMNSFLITFNIQWLNGSTGSLVIPYLGVWYFNVSKMLRDCELPDYARRYNRLVSTFCTIALSIMMGAYIYSFMENPSKMIFINDAGNLTITTCLFIMSLSFLIITVISWIHKFKGYED